MHDNQNEEPKEELKFTSASGKTDDGSRARARKTVFKARNKRGIRPANEKKGPFLSEFRKGGTILQALKELQIDRDTFHSWLKNDPHFAREFNKAQQDVTETCESAALRRAVDGTKRFVYYRGQVAINPKTGEPFTYQEHSDDLLKFLLRARDREKYGDSVKHEFDARIAQQIAAEFVKAVRRATPGACPNCRTNLNLPEKIAEELKTLSAKLTVK